MTRKRKQLPTFEKYKDGVLQMVENLGKTFTGPNEDWLPTLFLMTEKRQFVVSLKTVFATRESKVVLPGVLRGMFQKTKPSLAALVLSAWYTQVEPNSPLSDLALEMNAVFGASTAPDRKEILLVEVASMAGEDAMLSADIIRSPDKPPTLTDWRKWEEPAGGRFGNVLKTAFAAIAQKGESKQ